jgi:transposase
MSRALSVDLRVRVVAAVADGLTHRQAAERFGVSAASVSRWRALERERGDPRPKALGGDRRSGRIEAHRATILSVLAETPDITLDELRRRLAAKGLVFGDGTVRRFLKRNQITRKKRPPTHPSRTAPTS